MAAMSLELPKDPPPAARVDSAAEVAADLTLSVQELVKMRSNGRTRRFEVLARSRRDAQRDEVPAAFMAKSTSAGDGAALDAVVARQLIDWMRRHPQLWDGEPASFSINVSIGALEDPRFLEVVAAAMSAAGVPANSLGFEITEFACKQCRTHVQRFINTCEQMGCFVVLDNFTFDSAALPLLGSSAVRMVKIDPKLTTLAMKEKLPQAVVIAILQACKVLGVHCIAKNVETQAALDWLEAIGCDFAQGFALEKPLSLESLASPSPTLPRVRGKEGKARR
jgi:EAL domain-containing protein (putative c-di-GMP-specific phosphodiesterase class I)